MKTKSKIKGSLLVFFLFFGLMGMILVPAGAYATSVLDSVQVNQNVVNCNDNGICETWESTTSCPGDCSGMGGGHHHHGHGHGHGGFVLMTPDTEKPEIRNLRIEPERNSVQISWTTNENAIAKVYWGKTQSYEDGSLSEIIFSKNHAVKIEGLSESSGYFFKISVSDLSNNETVIRGLSFVTLSPPDTQAPANVSGLRAKVLKNSVLLIWKNPRDEDFVAVRVTKRESFFPRDFLEGKVIYEGSGTRAEDREVKKGVRYYYSVFSRDRSWNYSSGANVSAVFGEKKPVEKKETVEKKIAPELKKLSLFDFDFTQEGKKISFLGNKIKVKAGKNLKISVDANKIPKDVKKISLKLGNPENPAESFFFTFKLNKKKGVFETVLSPSQEDISYPLSISLKGFKNLEMKKIAAEIIPAAVKTKSAKEFFQGVVGGVNNFFSKVTSRLINTFLGIVKLFGIF